MKRYIIVGGEAELALLLHIFPQGVEELDGAFAVYSNEPPIGFDVVNSEDVPEGWEDAWRSFHHGVQVGRFWVGPPWEAVIIDPGRAFGTGAHSTTRVALELLQALEPGSLVDVGCGSGVLSIAAAKLGFAPVVAVDIDPAAVEVARENVSANRVDVDVRVLDALTEAPPRADVAVANIALDVVQALGDRLECEWLITSGYYETQQPKLPRFTHVEARTMDAWRADVWRASAAG